MPLLYPLQYSIYPTFCKVKRGNFRNKKRFINDRIENTVGSAVHCKQISAQIGDGGSEGKSAFLLLICLF